MSHLHVVADISAGRTCPFVCVWMERSYRSSIPARVQKLIEHHRGSALTLDRRPGDQFALLAIPRHAGRYWNRSRIFVNGYVVDVPVAI